MGTGKERIRRWRERNKVEGRKSITIIISKKAYHALNAEKQRTGDNYGAIVEKALLNIKRYTPFADNVTGNAPTPAVTVTTKKLIDEGDYAHSMSQHLTRDGAIIFNGEDTLNNGFLTRLLKTSKRKLFKR